MNIKQLFTTSSLFSKVLRVALIVALPFIGFYLGIKYQTFVTEPTYEPSHWSGYDSAPKKPVINLYPQKTEKVSVKLDYKGKLATTYPAYNSSIRGWNVIANPDGSLVNTADGKQYSYIFWEGEEYNIPVNINEGFVVKGSDTAQFLQYSLAKLGLTPKEYNEFVVYWLPEMQNNPYNLIHFAGKEYTDIAPLTITPKPDSMLRVFMTYKPLNEPVKVKEQVLKPFNRTGFAVVEWGGSEITE